MFVTLSLCDSEANNLRSVSFSHIFNVRCLLSFHYEMKQQYHVVPFGIGWVRAGLGLGLTGKLVHAWVGAWMNAWVGACGGGWMDGCMGGVF